MCEKQIIENLISSGEETHALEALDQNISESPEEADWWYMRGRLLWRMGEHSRAITDYEHAVALDPESPAAHALTLARDVMNFFNPDIFNP